MKLLSSLLLVALLVATLRADPDALARFRDRAARLPVPSEQGGFAFGGDVVMNGQVVGTFLFSAAPLTMTRNKEEQILWRVRQVGTVGRGEGSVTVATNAHVTRNLVSVSGFTRREAAGAVRTWTWARDEKGFRVEAREREKPVIRRVEESRPAVATLTAILLFCRAALPETGSYELIDLDPDWDPAKGEKPITIVSLDLEGPGRWRGRKALLAKARQGTRRITVAYHPETRDPLGIHMSEDGRSVDAWYLPKGTVTSRVPDDILDKPARTPRVAAARAALALATGDLALVEEVIHWPSLAEEAKAMDPEGMLTAEQMKAAILAVLTEQLTKSPRGEVEPFLVSSLEDFKVEMRGRDRATVVFPKDFNNLRLEVGRVDGFWYLVRLPRE